MENKIAYEDLCFIIGDMVLRAHQDSLQQQSEFREKIVAYEQENSELRQKVKSLESRLSNESGG